MKKALFLVDDFWHRADTIEPLQEILFPADEWKVVFTKDPKELYENADIDLLVSFKDPIENDQIPTPIWCDDKWTECFLDMIKQGVGFIAVHAATTDLPEDHQMVKELIHSVFVTHPQACEVRVDILKEHPVTEGVVNFTIPVNDEHYQMKMEDNAKFTILANTVSQNGSQPGLWVSEYGKGRICCFTPGHTTEALTCEGYTKIMKNAVRWCTR